VLDHEHEHGAGHDPHGFAGVAAAVRGGERARRLRRGLVVAVLALASLTLAAELALRITNARERESSRGFAGIDSAWTALDRARLFEASSDPVRRYALRPGAEGTVDGHLYRISQRRTRGPEVAAAKPARERRLLCLGDAASFGLGCDEEETLGARLAARAGAREAELGSGLAWRSLEMGVPGYHLGQILRALEADGLALEPDLVVLYLTASQIERSGFYRDDELGFRRDFLPLPDALKRSLWRWSHLYGWIAALHAHAAEDGPDPELEPRVPWAPVRPDNQEHARATLASIAALCRVRGVPLFVLHQPLLAPLERIRSADWPGLPLEAWFRGVCAELGLPALHLLGWLRGRAGDDGRSGTASEVATNADLAGERAQRLTVAGYAALARLAHEALRAEGLLP
jgi:hypothetical protein